jgi:hypothetical protein
MPKTYAQRIPFYKSRKPVDFIAGLNLFKENLFSNITNQAYTTLSPILTQEASASANQVIQSFLASIQPVNNPPSRNNQTSGISAGAGYSGGTSAAAKKILSSYNAYKATGKTSTPAKSKKK